MAPILSRVGHAVVSALTPDRYEHQGEPTWGMLQTYPQPVAGPTLGSVAREPSQFVRSLDPRSPEGIANLAMWLFPGVKGPGKLDPVQKAYLQQLQTFGYKGGKPYYLDTAPGSGYSKANVKGTPSLSNMENQLGYSSTNPIGDLYRNVSPDTGYANVLSMLGMEPSSSGPLHREILLDQDMVMRILRGYMERP